MEVRVLIWFNVWKLNGPLNLEMKRQRWPWLEVSLLTILWVYSNMCTRAHVGDCGWKEVYKHSGHTQSIIFIVWVKPISVSVHNWEKQGWLLCFAHWHQVCLYVYEVPAPANASEMERSDLKHVPGAKVKGHHIQTYPEKLCVRERRSLWDHLTNTLTHNIFFYYQHPVSLIFPFSLLIFLSFLPFAFIPLWNLLSTLW